jgi:putative solute:sodium symporter small subunit
MDKDSVHADRRKRAGLHEDYEKLSPIMKFGTNNWFRLVVIGFLVIFTYQLNEIKIGGFKLGFWFAQQGAIYVFVILIFVYIRLMNKLDKKYGFNEDDNL